MNTAGYRRGMRGGRPAARVLLAVALVALPLTGLALLTAGSPALPEGQRDAILRLAPGTGGEVQAVRSGTESESGARAATRAWGALLLGVLLGAATVVALRGSTPLPHVAIPALRTGRGIPAAGRGPPLLSD